MLKRTDPKVDYTKQDDPLMPTKADGDAGELEGYASVFWKVDSYGEFTVPGCFAKSIADRGPKAERNRIVFRYEHVVTIGKHTAMEEDDRGLLIAAYISDDGADGTRFRSHLRDGIQYGISIGYRNINYRPGTADDPLDYSDAPRWCFNEEGVFQPESTLGLTELKLKENSGVTFPAVDNALVDSYRSDAGLSALDNLLKACRDGRLTDDQRTALKRLADEALAALTPPVTPTDTREKADSDALGMLHEIDIELTRYGGLVA